MIVDKQLLTPKQVAEKLNINYLKVLDMIVMVEIDAYKIGGVYRITEGALFDFLEKHKFKSHWKK